MRADGLMQGAYNVLSIATQYTIKQWIQHLFFLLTVLLHQ